MKENLYIYYDEEGDFLEITFGLPAEKGGTEEIEEGIFLTREEDTGEIKSLGILSFKKRTQILKEILQRFNLTIPMKISF